MVPSRERNDDYTKKQYPTEMYIRNSIIFQGKRVGIYWLNIVATRGMKIAIVNLRGYF